MKFRVSAIIIGVATAMCAVGAQAQEVLSMEQCRDMALKNNKDMQAAHKQTIAAGFSKKSYKALFFPDFSASGTALYSTSDGGLTISGGNLPTFSVVDGVPTPTGGFAYMPDININYELGFIYTAGVQLKQPIYQGGKIRAAYNIAKLSEQMSLENERLTSTDVVLNTDNAYVLLVRANEMRKVAEKYNALLQELMRNVESAYKHGLKPQNDVLKVQVKLNESELQLRKAENAIRLARMNLCHCIGRPLTDEIDVADSIPSLLASVEDAQLDITSRPEYAILDKKVAIAEQNVKLSRSELLPKVGLQAGYNYLHGLKLNDENLFDKGGFSVLVNVSVPLFHFGERSNKLKAAKASLEQSKLEQANLNEKMTLELAQSANNLDEAQLECEIAERSLLQADENLRLSGSQYKVGLETLSDHLEAQALWQQAYATQIDSRYQLYITYLSYQKAAGKLNVNY